MTAVTGRRHALVAGLLLAALIALGGCESSAPEIRELAWRLVDFDGIREGYERLADAAAGRAKAEVVSASPLSGEQRDRLQRALSARTG